MNAIPLTALQWVLAHWQGVGVWMTILQGVLWLGIFVYAVKQIIRIVKENL